MKKVWIIYLREQPFDFYEGGGDFYQKIIPGPSIAGKIFQDRGKSYSMRCKRQDRVAEEKQQHFKARIQHPTPQ